MENLKEILHEKHIDLHIAEYNAMTMRHTYLLNMQILLVTIGIAWALFFGTIWNQNYEFILSWGFLLGWQICAIMYMYCFYISYQIISYFENELKPKIQRLTKVNDFWEIDAFFQKKSGKFRLLVEFAGIIVLTPLIIIICIYRYKEWIFFDWVGLIINFLFLIIILIFTIQLVNIRKRKWKFD